MRSTVGRCHAKGRVTQGQHRRNRESDGTKLGPNSNGTPKQPRLEFLMRNVWLALSAVGLARRTNERADRHPGVNTTAHLTQSGLVSPIFSSRCTLIGRNESCTQVLIKSGGRHRSTSLVRECRRAYLFRPSATKSGRPCGVMYVSSWWIPPIPS